MKAPAVQLDLFERSLEVRARAYRLAAETAAKDPHWNRQEKAERVAIYTREAELLEAAIAADKAAAKAAKKAAANARRRAAKRAKAERRAS